MAAAIIFFLVHPEEATVAEVFFHWKFAISKKRVRARLIFGFMKYLKPLRKLL